MLNDAIVIDPVFLRFLLAIISLLSGFDNQLLLANFERYTYHLRVAEMLKAAEVLSGFDHLLSTNYACTKNMRVFTDLQKC